MSVKVGVLSYNELKGVQKKLHSSTVDASSGLHMSGDSGLQCTPLVEDFSHLTLLVVQLDYLMNSWKTTANLDQRFGCHIVDEPGRIYSFTPTMLMNARLRARQGPLAVCQGMKIFKPQKQGEKKYKNFKIFKTKILALSNHEILHRCLDKNFVEFVQI